MRAKRKHKIRATLLDKKGRVLATAVNSYEKTHPIQQKYSDLYGTGEQPFLHAEIAALVRCKDPSKVDRIVIERYGKNGDPLPAKPCPICQGALRDYGITNIEHT